MKKRLIVFSALTIFILLSLAIGFLRQKIAYVDEIFSNYSENQEISFKKNTELKKDMKKLKYMEYTDYDEEKYGEIKYYLRFKSVTVFVDNKEVGVDYYITTKGYVLYIDKNGTEYVSENLIDISKYFDWKNCKDISFMEEATN